MPLPTNETGRIYIGILDIWRCDRPQPSVDTGFIRRGRRRDPRNGLVAISHRSFSSSSYGKDMESHSSGA